MDLFWWFSLCLFFIIKIHEQLKLYWIWWFFVKSRFWDLCVSVDYRRFPLFWHRFWDDIFFGCVGMRVWKKKSKMAKKRKKKWAAFYLFLCFILVYFSDFGRCARVFTYKNFGLLFLSLVFFDVFWFPPLVWVPIFSKNNFLVSSCPFWRFTYNLMIP